MDNSNPGSVPCDQTPERKRFVVVSGIPGSGKSTLARALAPALGLPLLDKDAILEHLFDQKGIGDPTWRRMSSRLSDSILQTEGAASNGAVLVSHWRLPGMRPQSERLRRGWRISMAGWSMSTALAVPNLPPSDSYNEFAIQVIGMTKYPMPRLSPAFRQTQI